MVAALTREAARNRHKIVNNNTPTNLLVPCDLTIFFSFFIEYMLAKQNLLLIDVGLFKYFVFHPLEAFLC